MEHFNRFGNMSPTQEYMHRPYLMNRAPFQIRGNLYFVGNLWCSSHLIDTGEGLILLDTPCAGSMPGLIHNIWKLGFNPEDLKYIIVSPIRITTPASTPWSICLGQKPSSVR